MPPIAKVKQFIKLAENYLMAAVKKYGGTSGEVESSQVYKIVLLCFPQMLLS